MIIGFLGAGQMAQTLAPVWLRVVRLPVPAWDRARCRASRRRSTRRAAPPSNRPIQLQHQRPQHQPAIARC